MSFCWTSDLRVLLDFFDPIGFAQISNTCMRGLTRTLTLNLGRHLVSAASPKLRALLCHPRSNPGTSSSLQVYHFEPIVWTLSLVFGPKADSLFGSQVLSFKREFMIQQ